MILHLIFGLLLGIFFFGGLWLTVRHLATTRYPFAVTLGSLFVRSAVTLAGFYVLIGGHWQNAVWGLIGFTAARFLLRWEGRNICT
jgi:F1F0 ATPase subunit 2